MAPDHACTGIGGPTLDLGLDLDAEAAPAPAWTVTVRLCRLGRGCDDCAPGGRTTPFAHHSGTSRAASRAVRLYVPRPVALTATVAVASALQEPATSTEPMKGPDAVRKIRTCRMLYSRGAFQSDAAVDCLSGAVQSDPSFFGTGGGRTPAACCPAGERFQSDASVDCHSGAVQSEPSFVST